MEKINIAELLRNCPNGMELDCTMFDNAKFIGVENYEKPICIRIGNGDIYLHLTKFGTWSFDKNAKCIIFPKGKTTWEGFHRPFKDGDILADDRGSICIYKGPMWYNKNLIDYYCGYRRSDYAFILKPFKDSHFGDINECRFATEEEKQKLFNTIKDNGYTWNAEIKTLEKLIQTEFHVGDWIVIDKPCQIISINDNGNYIVQYCDDEKTHELSKNFCEPHFHLWTIDDAKDGDVLSFYSEYKGNKIVQVGIIEKYVGKHGGCSNTFKIYVGVDWDNNLQMDKYMGCPDIHPASKEQRDFLFQKIKEAGYKWNANRKTLYKLIEPKFKDGDVVVNASNKDSNAFIYAGENNDYYECYVGLVTGINPTLSIDKDTTWVSKESGIRLATEEEKARLFQAIKDNGYRWNCQANKLEKLIIPNFKKGDKIRVKNGVSEPRIIDDVCDTFYALVPIGKIDFTDQDNWELVPDKLIEPKFKVGDKIKYKRTNEIFIITYKNDLSYYVNNTRFAIWIKDQDNYELVPNKFDITTLKPFESRVLIRDHKAAKWRPAIWGYYDNEKNIPYPYVVVGGLAFACCIPYEGNEHLCGTTDDCEDFYKTW